MSLSLTGFGSIAADRLAVLAAERNGLDGIWYAEHIGAHDAVVPATVFLESTERLELALMGISTAGRHPGVAAMELASLAEIAPGRVRAAIGTGAPEMIAKLGHRISKPVGSTVALHQALKQALTGNQLTGEHPGFEFDHFQISPASVPPALDIMAVRPRMVEAAARHADGLCLSAGSSRAYLVDTVQRAEAILDEHGRSRDQFRISAVVPAFITTDRAAARHQLAAMLATFDPATTEYLAAGAIPEGALVSAVTGGDMSRILEVVTEDVAETVAMICAPHAIGDTLVGYADTGIDEIALALFAPPEAVPDLVELVGAARPSLTAAR